MAAEKTAPQVASKVKFCWECGNKLWNVKIYTKLVIDGHERTLHKKCAKELQKGKGK